MTIDADETRTALAAAARIDPERITVTIDGPGEVTLYVAGVVDVRQAGDLLVALDRMRPDAHRWHVLVDAGPGLRHWLGQLDLRGAVSICKVPQ